MTPGQLSLIDAPAGRVRATDPETSVHAARQADAKETEADIERLIRANPERDWIADDVCRAIPARQPQTIKTSFSRVKRKLGMVQTGTRPSDLGVAMGSWRLPEAS